MKDETLHLTDGNVDIEMLDTVKYLGIHFDRFLSFDVDMNKVSKKVNQGTNILWKMRGYIDEKLAKYLYTTLIHPFLAILTLSMMAVLIPCRPDCKLHITRLSER